MAFKGIVNQQDVNNLKASLSTIKGGAETALIRATNRSMAESKTNAARKVNQKVNLTITKIKKDIKVNKMHKGNLNGNIYSSGFPLPLINYGARQTQKGVTVKVLRAGKRDLVKHAFIATMKSGHKGAFWREKIGGGKNIWKAGKRISIPTWEKNDPRSRKFRLKIKELYGPRMQDVLGGDDIFPLVLTWAGFRVAVNMDREVNYLLSQARSV